MLYHNKFISNLFSFLYRGKGRTLTKQIFQRWFENTQASVNLFLKNSYGITGTCPIFLNCVSNIRLREQLCYYADSLHAVAVVHV